jgi:hypothetical protein
LVGGNACYFLHEPYDWNSFLFIWDGHIWGHGPCLTLCGPGDSCTCVFDVCSFTLVSFLDTGNMLISYYLLSLSVCLKFQGLLFWVNYGSMCIPVWQRGLNLFKSVLLHRASFLSLKVFKV